MASTPSEKACTMVEVGEQDIQHDHDAIHEMGRLEIFFFQQDLQLGMSRAIPSGLRVVTESSI